MQRCGMGGGCFPFCDSVSPSLVMVLVSSEPRYVAETDLPGNLALRCCTPRWERRQFRWLRRNRRILVPDKGFRRVPITLWKGGSDIYAWVSERWLMLWGYSL